MTLFAFYFLKKRLIYHEKNVLKNKKFQESDQKVLGHQSCVTQGTAAPLNKLGDTVSRARWRITIITSVMCRFS